MTSAIPYLNAIMTVTNIDNTMGRHGLIFTDWNFYCLPLDLILRKEGLAGKVLQK